MATQSTPISLDLVLTLMQFTALALPAIGIYLQIIIENEENPKMELRYNMCRLSLVLLLMNVIILLFYLIPSLPGAIIRINCIIAIQVILVYLAVMLLILGIVAFGISLMTTRHIGRSEAPIRKSIQEIGNSIWTAIQIWK